MGIHDRLGSLTSWRGLVGAELKEVTMARIEWSALEGGEVETVVSILLYNEYPQATRIRPSQ